MRITVSHNRPKEEIRRSIDSSFDDFFKGVGFVPIQIANEQRQWQGNTPIKGFVEVTDRDVTIDADLGLLEKLLPAKQTREALESRVKGLLQ